MDDDLVLEDDQKHLLAMLADAARGVPREQRRAFVRTNTFMGQTQIHHPGLANGKAQVYPGDLDALMRSGLLAPSSHFRSLGGFDVTPRGFEYSRRLARTADEAVLRVEETVTQHLLSPDGFRRRYPTVYNKWADAESKLWSAQSDRELTTIGHLCREAMQEFSSALVDAFPPPNVPVNKASTVARLKAVLESAPGLGGTERAHLAALVAYWGSLSDLVQRQEHGALKEGEPVGWEDARRVVFQTCNLLYELDRSLTRGSRSGRCPTSRDTP
ncbi:MAG: hypothetical protein ABR543_01045 [Gemmatimonadaceae bacterium]